VGKSEGKMSLGRPRSRWVENIKIDLTKTGWGSVEYTDLPENGNNGGL
jgi:hypothetical protein